MRLGGCFTTKTKVSFSKSKLFVLFIVNQDSFDSKSYKQQNLHWYLNTMWHIDFSSLISLLMQLEVVYTSTNRFYILNIFHFFVLIVQYSVSIVSCTICCKLIFCLHLSLIFRFSWIWIRLNMVLMLLMSGYYLKCVHSI